MTLFSDVGPFSFSCFDWSASDTPSILKVPSPPTSESVGADPTTPAPTSVTNVSAAVSPGTGASASAWRRFSLRPLDREAEAGTETPPSLRSRDTVISSAHWNGEERIFDQRPHTDWFVVRSPSHHPQHDQASSEAVWSSPVPLHFGYTSPFSHLKNRRSSSGRRRPPPQSSDFDPDKENRGFSYFRQICFPLAPASHLQTEEKDAMFYAQVRVYMRNGCQIVEIFPSSETLAPSAAPDAPPLSAAPDPPLSAVHQPLLESFIVCSLEQLSIAFFDPKPNSREEKGAKLGPMLPLWLSPLPSDLPLLHLIFDQLFAVLATVPANDMGARSDVLNASPLSVQCIRHLHASAAALQLDNPSPLCEFPVVLRLPLQPLVPPSFPDAHPLVRHAAVRQSVDREHRGLAVDLILAFPLPLPVDAASRKSVPQVLQSNDILVCSLHVAPLRVNLEDSFALRLVETVMPLLRRVSILQAQLRDRGDHVARHAFPGSGGSPPPSPSLSQPLSTSAQTDTPPTLLLLRDKITQPRIYIHVIQVFVR